MGSLLLAWDGAGCTAAPSPVTRSGEPGSPGGTTTLSPVATIANEDDGKALQVQVGQVVDVALRAADSMENWQVDEPDPTILAPTVHRGATALRGVTLRAFKAVGPGTATISATDRPQCNPGQVCAQVILSFNATVEVRV